MKKLLLLIISFGILAAKAQNLIAPVTISVPANPPANISAWATQMPPFMITAQSKLRNGQVPPEVVESKILVTIRSGGALVCGAFTPATAPASVFTAPLKNWTGTAALALLGKECTLPPGTYELCVQFYTMNAAGNGLLGEACKTFTIADNKPQNYTAPQNIMPADGKKLSAEEAKLPILFRWTPVLPRPKEDIVYKLKLIEMRNGQSKMQALRENQPIAEQEIKNTTQATVKLAQRYNGLIWYVEAVGTERLQGGQPKSYGKSEATVIQASQNLTSCQCGTWSSNILFDYYPAGLSGGNSLPNQSVACNGTYNVQQNSAVFFGNTNFSCNAPCTHGEVADVYKPNTSTPFLTDAGYGSIAEMPLTECGTYKMVLKPSCWDGGVETHCPVNCTVFFNVQCVQACNCIDIKSGISCHGTMNGVPAYSIIDTITNTCNKAITAWTITSSSGHLDAPPSPQSLGTGVNLPFESMLVNASSGIQVLTYTFTFSDGTQCKVMKDATLPNCNTSCSYTCHTSLTVSPLGGGANIIATPAAAISLECGKSYDFGPLLICTPANSSVGIRSAKVYDAGNVTPAWVSASFLLGGSGILAPPAGTTGTFYIKYYWGTVANPKCDSSVYTMNISCLPLPVCGCGQWNGISLSSVDANGMPVTETKNCSDSFEITPAVSFTIIPDYTCNNNVNCPVSYKYDVFTPSGTQLYVDVDYSTIVPAEMNDCSGYYKIVIKPTCGNQACPPCTVYLKRSCPPCTCSANDSLTCSKPGALLKLHCSDTLLVQPQDKFNAFSKVFSGGGGPACTLTSSAKLYDPAGNIINASTASSSIAWPVPFSFTQCGGVYRFVFKASCGGVLCDSCTYYVKVDCPCHCSSNDSAAYSLNGVAGKIKCSDTLKVFSTDVFNSFSKSYNCSYPTVCNATATATIYNQAGGIIGTSTNGQFTWPNGKSFTGCDSVYRIVFSGTCGGDNCQVCNVYIKVKCPPPPCSCGGWDPITYKAVTGAGTIASGGNLTVQQNVLYKFGTRLNCNPTGNSICVPGKYSYIIYDGSVVVAQGLLNSLLLNYSFPECGKTYKVVFKGTCSGVECDSCWFNVYVDCCGAGDMKLFTVTGLPVSLSNCIQPGNYKINVVNATPVPATINYQLISMPDGIVMSSGAFPYSASGYSITIPYYVCGAKQGFTIVCDWNNKNCKDTLSGKICEPPCCSYVTPGNHSQVVSGPPPNRVSNFNVCFVTPSMPLLFNRIKVQLIEITVNGSAMPRPQANIQVVNLQLPSVTGNVIPAVTSPGNALWFNAVNKPALQTSLCFKGTIFLGAGSPMPGTVRYKLRFTFYRQNGTCAEQVCESDIQF